MGLGIFIDGGGSLQPRPRGHASKQHCLQWERRELLASNSLSEATTVSGDMASQHDAGASPCATHGEESVPKRQVTMGDVTATLVALQEEVPGGQRQHSQGPPQPAPGRSRWLTMKLVTRVQVHCCLWCRCSDSWNVQINLCSRL